MPTLDLTNSAASRQTSTHTSFRVVDMLDIPVLYHFVPVASNKTFSSTRPDFVLLIGPIKEDWHLVCPLSVMRQVEDDGSYLMSDDVFLVHGIGDTMEEAYNDYVTALVELYNLIEEDVQEDNPLSQAEFQHIQSYLRKSS